MASETTTPLSYGQVDKNIANSSEEEKQKLAAIIPQVTQLLFEHNRPERVIEIGQGDGSWLRAFVDRGVREVAGVYFDKSELMAGNSTLSDVVSTNELREAVTFKKRYDLCLCINALEHTEPQYEDNLIATLVAAADVLLICLPAPGQGNVNAINVRPISHWASKFWKHGYVILDNVRPHFEGMNFLPETQCQLSAYTLRKIFNPASAPELERLAPQLQSILSEKDSRIQSLFLQRMYLDLEVDQLQRSYSELQATVSSQTAQLSDELQEKLNLVDFEIPRDRIDFAGENLFIFAFKTHAAQVFARMPWFEHTQLLENGSALGMPTIMHEQIRNEGCGRYSMWKNGVYFSTPDNSDPRKNGRTYSFKVPAYVKFLEGMPDVTIEKFGF